MMERRLFRKRFIKYSFFSVLGTLGVSCYILADTFFVSKGLGMKGLTALNLAIPAYNFIHGTGLMIGIGGGTRFSICGNWRDRRKTDEIFMNSVYLGLFLGGIFVILGLFAADPVAVLLGANQETMAMTSLYLKWLFLFAPDFIMNNILLCFVRNDNSPALASSAMLLGSFSNILMDYIFIFIMKMGMFGAVFATGVSPIIGMAVMSLHWRKPDRTLRIACVGIRGEVIKGDFMLGFPSLITQVASGVAVIVFNILILGMKGNIGVAAYGVITNLSLVITSVYMGIGQGIQPLLSESYGKGEYDQIKLGMRYGNLTAGILSCVIYTLIFLFAHEITDVFNSEHNLEMREISVTGLRLYFLSVAFVGYNTILAILFTSTEKALPAQMLSLVRGIVLLVPLAFVMSRLWGMTGIWLACPVTECLAAAAGYGVEKRNQLTYNRNKESS